mmetsp:Transcript_24039/g.44628  ORF Transcript_24039/g.44628 Transcript_24039/m.44628 type:complete len:217 (-) Transcript_24039:176-826(-)
MASSSSCFFFASASSFFCRARAASSFFSSSSSFSFFDSGATFSSTLASVVSLLPLTTTTSFPFESNTRGALGLIFNFPAIITSGSIVMDLHVMFPNTCARLRKLTTSTLMLPSTRPSTRMEPILSIFPTTLPVGPMTRFPCEISFPVQIPLIRSSLSNFTSPFTITFSPIIVSGISSSRERGESNSLIGGSTCCTGCEGWSCSSKAGEDLNLAAAL